MRVPIVDRPDRGRRVQQRIYADRPQCVAVVGDPRIGKSSFLRRLVESAEAGGPSPPPGTRFVELALREGEAGSSPEAFLRLAVERAAAAEDAAGPARESAAPGAADDAQRAYGRFQRLVESVARDGGRLILLLDDFDKVTGSAAFPIQFFSFLRSLANNFPVAYVTTSRLDLQRLCALKEVEESPFFNIFQNVSLGPMDEPQVREMVAARAPADAGAVGDWAVEESGGLPAVAAACCDAADAGAEPGTEAGRGTLDAAAAAYLAELWEHLDAPHRDLLARLARGEPPGERDARPLRDLGPRRGYIAERDGGWRIVSPALARFVERRAGGGGPPGLLGKIRRALGGRRAGVRWT